MANTTLEKWEEKSIKQLAVLICDGDWIETKNQSFNGIRLIQTGNIGEGCYKDKTENARYISEETFKKLNCTEIFSGDCLVSRLPQPLGRACIIPYKNERMITAVDCSIIRFNNKVITPKYFIYYSMSDSYNKKVTALSTGATRQRISRKNLETTTIPLPPLPEQERIVAKLDKAFEAIDKAKTIAETNLKNAKELFESALNNVFTKNTDGWEEKKLDDVCTYKSGTTISKDLEKDTGDLLYIKVGDMNIRGNEELITTSTRFASSAEISAAQIIPTGSVIFPKRGGAIATNKKRKIIKPTIVDLNTMAIIPNKELDSNFFYYWFGQINLIDISNGTTIPQINNYSFQNLRIKYPTLLDQQKIVEQLDKLQEQTKQLEAIYTQKIKECDELKQSILQKAFRGEL